MESNASSADSQAIWSRQSSSQMIWSRRPSVDSIASTVDSLATPALGFRTAGAVVSAAQKLKRLSQDTKDFATCACNAGIECPYCCADLCKGSIVFLNDKSKPDSHNCQHFLHAECASAILRRARKGVDRPVCPKCKYEFEETHIVSVPHPFEDPDGWYQALDVPDLDRVPRERILEALVAFLPIEAMAIKDLVWRKAALRGKLTSQECKEILGKIEKQMPKIQRPQPCTPPKVEQGDTWFAYWDVGGAGLLTQEEVTRALLRSFPNHDLPLLREAIDLAWQEHVQRNSESVEMLGPEAFANQNSGFMGLVFQKYQGAKYWKIWGSDCDMKNRLPRCMNSFSDGAF
jgi:hypothetical protein